MTSVFRYAFLWTVPAILFAAEPKPRPAQDSKPQNAAVVASPRLTGTPFLTVWRPDDYGAQPENNRVVQHPGTGLIYVGNGGGVLEFDGARWRLIPAPDGGAVIALGVDRRGRIWGATNALIFRLEPDARGQLRVRSMLDRLPKEFQRHAILSGCVVTEEGVYFFDQNNLMFFGLDDAPARTWTVAEHPVVALRLWEIGGEPFVLLGGSVVLRLRAGRLERVPSLTGTVWAARAEPDGAWQLLTSGGTDRWDGQKNLTTGRLPAGEGAQSATFLTDGRSVFASLRSGLVVCDRAGRVLQTIGRAQGLPANQVMDVMEDRQGGVWAAFRNGVARVQLDSPYALHGPAQGLEGTVHSLARHGDHLFVAGTEGVYQRGKDGRYQPLPEVATAVREVVAHDEWLFILSTRFRGFRLDHDRRANELENRNYFGLVPLAGQPGWFAHGANEGVRWAHFESGKWITQGPLAALRGRANVLLESPAGVVWAAHGGGAQRVDFRAGLRADAPVRRFGAAEGVPAPPSAIFLLGGRVVALAGGKLVRFDEAANRFGSETRLVGLEALMGPEPNARPLASVRVSGGTIWLQAGPPSRGIARLVADGEARWRVELLPGEPLRHLQPTTLYHEAATETLWIGGHGALVSRDLTWQPTRTTTAPAAAIRRIETAAGELLFGGWSAPASVRGPTEPLRLAPDQDALSIQFAAPAFAPDHAGVTQIEYRTRLDGLDRDWSAWSRQAERDFTSLPWRAFTFRVQARDDAGRIGGETTLAFAIAPAWWATRWAWAGYGVFGLFGVAGIVRLRTHALHRRAEQLEKVVTDRTHELAQSNAQLATQNVELARLMRLELDEKLAAQLSEQKARLELLRYQLTHTSSSTRSPRCAASFFPRPRRRARPSIASPISAASRSRAATKPVPPSTTKCA